MPDKQTVEKYIRVEVCFACKGVKDSDPNVEPCALCEGTGVGQTLNPAWADYIQAFAKEMARHIVESWRVNEFAQCLYCVAELTHVGHGVEWRDTTQHKSTCPVPRAQEYLKG